MAAIEFARVRYISRSDGGSVTRQGAYAARDYIACQRTGQTYDFRHKTAAAHCEVLLPPGAPPGLATVAALTNAMEKAENRKNSQVAREFVIALPAAKEVSHGDRVELLRTFVQEQFVSKGLGAVIAIHAPDPRTKGQKVDRTSETANWHAHVLVTTRYVTGTGLGAKARDLDPQVRRGARGKAFVTEADRWGALWRDHQNAYFRAWGMTLRVDPTAIQTGPNIGPVRFRGAAGEETAADAEKLRAANEAAARNPAKVVANLTARNATFTNRDIDAFLRKHIEERDDRKAIKAAVLALPNVLKLYDRTMGESAGRYTTRAVRDQEIAALGDAAAVARAPRQGSVSETAIRMALAKRSLREDQRAAFDLAVSDRGLVIIEGRAGTGKSYTLGAVREAHEASGLRVIGLGTTNEVKQQLAADGFREAATLHSALFRLKNGRTKWDNRTVLIVDEAAMADAKITGELLAEARRAGAKVILAGDDRQLASIERGGLFRQLIQQHGSAEIHQVQRQRVDWQRQASEDMAAGRFFEAIKAFDQHGAINCAGTDAQARAQLVAAWARDTKDNPGASRFVFAYTNRDVDWMNAELREVRIDRGELGDSRKFLTKHGEAEFAIGDRVQFTATLKTSGISNGNVGTITDVRSDRISAQLDDGKLVDWKPSQFHGFRHGYAGTIYKGQGKSLDSTYLLHTKHWHSSNTYVALTRQKERVQLFVALETAPDIETLACQMARREERGASLTWATAEELPAIHEAMVAKDRELLGLKQGALECVAQAYREPEAVDRFRAMVERYGWTYAGQQLSADPESLGALRGKKTFMSGKRQWAERDQAERAIAAACNAALDVQKVQTTAINKKLEEAAQDRQYEQQQSERDVWQETMQRRAVAAEYGRQRSSGRGQGMGMGH